MTKEKKVKLIETVTVPSEEYLEDNYKSPSKFFIRDAMGDAVFYLSRDRQKIQDQVDEYYGKGKYVVRAVLKAQAR